MNMIIGFMRNSLKPTYFAKLTAILCKTHEIDLIYLRPRDIDINKNQINGKMFIDNKWINVETDLPAFIDISPYCFKAKNRNIMNYLRNNTFLSDNRMNRLTKEKVQNRLIKDEGFSHLVIPTHKAENFEDVVDFITDYSVIVMKPIHGERGNGVYILRKEGDDDTYLLGYKTEEKRLSSDELFSFFEEFIQDKKYILQKYISSRSLQGDPFDCRIHVEKNRNGKWTIARKFIRIGIGQKVISNVNQGGGIADPEPFLTANFGDKWESIDKKLDELAATLPQKVEKLRKTHINSLGLDVAIDRDGKLYLFEINSAPTTVPLRAEAAMLRTDYYKYVLENKVKVNA